MNQLTRWNRVAVLLLAVIAGCSPDKEHVKPPTPFPSPMPIAWQRPVSPIAQASFAQVHLTGDMILHQATVNSVAFSQSGTRMASAGADNITAVWNLANGEPLIVQRNNDGRRVFFGPDDATLITVSSSGTARVWAITMGPPPELQELLSFNGYEPSAAVVAQSPDRTRLAFGAANGGIRIWRIPEGESAADLRPDGSAVQLLVFSPDGTRLVSISGDHGLRLWSVQDGGLLHDLTDPSQTPLRVAFSPDSSQLAVANKNTIQVWDVESGEIVYSVPTAENAAASVLVYSPDGTMLAGCGPQPVLGIWNSVNGQLFGGLPSTSRTCSSLSFSPDSRLLVSLALGGQDIFLWDITHITDDVPIEQKQLRRRDRQNLGLFHDLAVYDAAWSPDGRFLVLISEEGPLYVLSTAE